MPSVYLVRHGEYENPLGLLAGRLPLPLSNVGKQQAERLRTYFATRQIGHIYSSAVLRSQETSQIIADGKIPVIYDQRLLETFSAYQGYWAKNWHGDGYHFFSHRSKLGGESQADLQKRMVDFWTETTLDLAENIIISSHGDPLQALYAYLKNIPLPDYSVKEENIPGWLDRGGTMEIIWRDKDNFEIKESINL